MVAGISRLESSHGELAAGRLEHQVGGEGVSTDRLEHQVGGEGAGCRQAGAPGRG